MDLFCLCTAGAPIVFRLNKNSNLFALASSANVSKFQIIYLLIASATVSKFQIQINFLFVCKDEKKSILLCSTHYTACCTYFSVGLKICSDVVQYSGDLSL